MIETNENKCPCCIKEIWLHARTDYYKMMYLMDRL